MFALNQGEVCTCPSRAVIHESNYDRFMERAIARTEAIVQADPRNDDTMLGAQAASEQKEKILSYFDIGRSGRRRGADRWHRRRSRRRPVRRVLRQADDPQGPQQDARVPGGEPRRIEPIAYARRAARPYRTGPSRRILFSPPRRLGPGNDRDTFSTGLRRSGPGPARQEACP